MSDDTYPEFLADIRAVLSEAKEHSHSVPGRWDWDGSECGYCPRLERLRAWERRTLAAMNGPAS